MVAIRKVAGVVLDTDRLDAAVRFYAEGYGLALAAHDADSAHFDGVRGERDVLILRQRDRPGLAGFRLGLNGPGAVAEARSTLAARGHAVAPPRFGAEGFSIRTPDGQTVDLTPEGDLPDLTPTPDGRPICVSHLVMNSPAPAAMVRFFTRDLGFRVTDAYENDLLVFLKCDQPQHHCIGISPGDAGALNHFSVDVGSIDGLMKGIGRMQKAGFTPIWGPGRHGPGGNVFAYFEDPTGFVAEFTCDVLQIDDPESWQARHWPRVPENANVWGTGGPTPRAIALMSGQA
ncbi:MAG: VOC family protein [Rhodobacteraceae bacterium]|nr:VOC family protein [Paracoccaceae bacterium]